MAKTTKTKNTLEDFKLEYEDLPTKAQLDRRKRELDAQRAKQLAKDNKAKARAKTKRKKGSLFSRLKNRIGAFIWV